MSAAKATELVRRPRGLKNNDSGILSYCKRKGASRSKGAEPDRRSSTHLPTFPAPPITTPTPPCTDRVHFRARSLEL